MCNYNELNIINDVNNNVNTNLNSQEQAHNAHMNSLHLLESADYVAHAAQNFDYLNLGRYQRKAIEKLGWITPSITQAILYPRVLDQKHLMCTAPENSGTTSAVLLAMMRNLTSQDFSSAMVLYIVDSAYEAQKVYKLACDLASYQHEANFYEFKDGFTIAEAGSVPLVRTAMPNILIGSCTQIKDMLNAKLIYQKAVKWIVLDGVDCPVVHTPKCTGICLENIDDFIVQSSQLKQIVAISHHRGMDQYHHWLKRMPNLDIEIFDKINFYLDIEDSELAKYTKTNYAQYPDYEDALEDNNIAPMSNITNPQFKMLYSGASA